MSIILFPTLGWLYVMCYFGDEVTSSFESVSDATYQCNWYLFSLPIQKHVILMMNMAQQPLYIGNFGSIHCTRDIYARVLSILQIHSISNMMRKTLILIH